MKSGPRSRRRKVELLARVRLAPRTIYLRSRMPGLGEGMGRSK